MQTLTLASHELVRRGRFLWKFATELGFDVRYGVRTRGVVRYGKQSFAENDPFAHAVDYEGVWSSTFHKAVRSAAIGDRSQYVFVDLGCGRGKALLLAAGYGFKRLIGVELSEQLAQDARHNIDQFWHRRKPIAPAEVVCGDAAAFDFPDEPLFIYMHNPFDAVILSAVLTRLRSSLVRLPRPALVLYHAPTHRDVFAETDFLTHRANVFGGFLYASTLEPGT